MAYRASDAMVAFASGACEETVRALGRRKTNSTMLAYLRGGSVVKAAAAPHNMAKVMIEAKKTLHGALRESLRGPAHGVRGPDASEEEERREDRLSSCRKIRLQPLRKNREAFAQGYQQGWTSARHVF